jgi:hypothetical protein
MEPTDAGITALGLIFAQAHFDDVERQLVNIAALNGLNVLFSKALAILPSHRLHRLPFFRSAAKAAKRATTGALSSLAARTRWVIEPHRWSLAPSIPAMLVIN